MFELSGGLGVTVAAKHGVKPIGPTRRLLPRDGHSPHLIRQALDLPQALVFRRRRSQVAAAE